MLSQVSHQTYQRADAGSATDLTRLISGYRLNGRTEGKSDKTIAIVVNSVVYLERFLSSEGLPTDVCLIGAKEIRAFTLYPQLKRCFSSHPWTRVQDRGLSGHIIKAYLRSVRSLWSRLASEEIVGTNPFARLKIPKAPRKVIPTSTSEQLTRLIEEIDVSQPQGYRDYAIVLLLVDTGMRVSELTGLKLEDVNVERRILKVWGKGAQERVVPFGVRVQRALLRYVSFYRAEPDTPRIKEFFLTYSG